ASDDGCGSPTIGHAPAAVRSVVALVDPRIFIGACATPGMVTGSLVPILSGMIGPFLLGATLLALECCPVRRLGRAAGRDDPLLFFAGPAGDDRLRIELGGGADGRG